MERLSYLEKRPDTLLSTLSCRVVRNSITGLSEMVSDKLQHEDLPLMLEINTLHMIQGSQNGI